MLRKNILYINELYYINVDSEKERNNEFINNYKKFNLNIPVHRVSGIVPKKGYKNISKGEKGCSLSHIKILKCISRKKNGWYLICEDDCVGNFNLIGEKTKLIRNLFPFIGVINLFSEKTTNNGFGFNTCTSCYLVKPWCAEIMYKIMIKGIKERPCDCNLHLSKIMYIYGFHLHNCMSISGKPSTIQKINTKMK